MFINLTKNKKAQNTAEYAILISLVVAGIIGVQTFAQRAFQARVRDAAVFMAKETQVLGNTLQYESYAKNKDFRTESQEYEYEDIKGTSTAWGGGRNESRKGTEIVEYEAGRTDLGDALGGEDLGDATVPEEEVE